MKRAMVLLLALIVMLWSAGGGRSQEAPVVAKEATEPPRADAGSTEAEAAPALPAAEDERTLPATAPVLPAGLPESSDAPAAGEFAPPVSSNEEAPPQPAQWVEIPYTVQQPIEEVFRTADGRTVRATRFVTETRTARLDVNEDLAKIDLPPAGKRAAVLAVTAARHPRLLANLKNAKTSEEKAKHSLALKENYVEHYAVETWWREQKLAELESRLKELRAQVTQRQEAEEKYVAAAMTIAELWADGIGITPPTPGRLPGGTATDSLPGPQSRPSFQPLPTYGTPAVAPTTGAATFPGGTFAPHDGGSASGGERPLPPPASATPRFEFAPTSGAKSQS